MNGSNPATDADLVRRVIGGEREAFAGLVRGHQSSIYRHLRGMGLDHDTALDLVQDAFVRAYDRLAECRDPRHFRAWLFRIARNLCLDHLKNVRRLTVPFSSVKNIESVDDAGTERSDVRHALSTALDRLPTALREAFLLKHDAGYTYDEVADITRATPSAVKMRVHRAREALREALTELGVHAA